MGSMGMNMTLQSFCAHPFGLKKSPNKLVKCERLGLYSVQKAFRIPELV